MLIMLFYAFINAFIPEQPKWQELTAFEIYSKVSVNQFQQLSDAEIKKMPYKVADLKEAQRLLSMAKPKLAPILWKGMGYLAVAKFKDGSIRRILINTYGSSFRDGTGKQDYTLEDNAEAWHTLITQKKP